MNKQRKSRIGSLNTEDKPMVCQTGEVGRQAKWAKRSRRYRLLVMESVSHGDERCSTGNTVKGVVRAMRSDRWQLHVQWVQQNLKICQIAVSYTCNYCSNILYWVSTILRLKTKKSNIPQCVGPWAVYKKRGLWGRSPADGKCPAILNWQVLRRSSQFTTQAALFPFHTRKHRGPEKLIDPPIIIQLGNR